MHRDLLPRDEYYRPTQARELREKSDRLGRWSESLGTIAVGGGTLSASCALVGWFGLVFGLGPPAYTLLSVAAVLIIEAGACGLAGDFLKRQARRMDAEARQLEAEHHARYDALPGSEAP